MAKTPTQLSNSNFLHPYQFSDCSITYFRAYLNELNMYVYHGTYDSSHSRATYVAFYTLLTVNPTV